MLDRKFIVESQAEIKQNCENRGVQVDVDRFVELDGLCRTKLNEVMELNRSANEVSKSIGKAKDAEEREARKNEGRRLRELKDAAQSEHDSLESELIDIQRMIPNLAHVEAPIGKDDKANLERGRGKAPIRDFDFKPLDHVALGEKLDLFDFAAGSKTTGHGFYFLKNDAVLLDFALQRYALDILLKHGFTITLTPDLARNQILEGTGFNPRGDETQIYRIADTDLSLVATAEITLGGSLSGETLNDDQFPIKICGVSHCFRTEAGAHGQATRGIYRVHQFTKVEMFAFTLPEQSGPIHEELRDIESEIFDGLGIPYRIVETATGDLGGSAFRKWDLEAWMPGRGEAGEFGEVTSTSNCTDYQARRLNVRYKTKGEKGTRFVHTLNGTAVATSRAMIAVLENYQNEDGSVTVPSVLQPLMGKELIALKS